MIDIQAIGCWRKIGPTIGRSARIGIGSCGSSPADCRPASRSLVSTWVSRKPVRPIARMLITVPLTIWSTRNVTESQACSSPITMPVRMPAAIPTPRFCVRAAASQAPNAAASIIPSIAILTTPLRSQNSPASAPSVIGVAKRRVVASMLAAIVAGGTSCRPSTTVKIISATTVPMMKRKRLRDMYPPWGLGFGTWNLGLGTWDLGQLLLLVPSPWPLAPGPKALALPPALAQRRLANLVARLGDAIDPADDLLGGHEDQDQRLDYRDDIGRDLGAELHHRRAVAQRAEQQRGQHGSKRGGAPQQRDRDAVEAIA